MPVYGQFRRFIFNYGVGNYEAAMGNFALTSIDGGTMASGVVGGATRQAATEAAEEGVLRFSQTTASPLFSEEGTFGGRTIGQVANQLRSGALSPSEVPVGVVMVLMESD